MIFSKSSRMVSLIGEISFAMPASMIIWLLLMIAPTQLKGGNTDCYTSIQLLWSEEVSEGPFASSPVLLDLPGSGGLYAVAASFDGRVHALDTITGAPLEGWPVNIPHSSIHAKPIPYDIDNNGHLDIIIITSQGEIVVLGSNGETKRKAELDSLLVQRDWHEKSLASDRAEIHQFILDEMSLTAPIKKYVAVDPHVLADPVLMDLNNDGVIEELVIVVSYYLDENDYPQSNSVQGLDKRDWDQYLVSALLLYNLTTMEVSKTYHLELTTHDLSYPGYILASPLIVDLEGDGELEIIVGSATGKLHVMDINGKPKEGFPAIVDSIHTDIAAEDVTGDGILDLIFVDTSGTVHCLDSKAQVIWETELDGDSFSRATVATLINNLRYDVVISTDLGMIHVLNGENGKAMENWPRKVGSFVESSPLVTKFCDLKQKTVVVLASDGHLHLISAEGNCKQTINLGEKSYVDLTVFQRDENNQGILVLTKDGTVMCIGETMNNNNDNNCLNDTNHLSHIQIHLPNVSHVTGTEFAIPYSISNAVSGEYVIRVYIGKRLLYEETITITETFHYDVLTVLSPNSPMSGHLQVHLIDKHKQMIQDVVFVHFNTLWKDDVKLLFMFPVLMLSGLLLFGFGFQAAELLPFTQQSKDL